MPMLASLVDNRATPTDDDVNMNKSNSSGIDTSSTTSSKGNNNTTLVGVLRRNASERPQHQLVRWLDSKGRISQTLTYAELLSASGAVADLLDSKRVKPGERVMVAYPPGPAFLAGFFGCLRAGVIPCSVYPPNPATTKEKALHAFSQFNTQVKEAGARYGLTTSSFKLVLKVASTFKGLKTSVKWLATDTTTLSRLLKRKTKRRQDHDVSSMEDTAFIQYSSGSTSAPKGVVISHAAIMHNLWCIKKTSFDPFLQSEDDTMTSVGWLPQYHDYGLIVGFLMSVYSHQSPLVAFSPMDFIRNPMLWVNAIHKFKATHTAAPNFAYALLARRMKAAQLNNPFDTLQCASIAAEPNAPETIQAMKQIGIPSRAIQPCYGMAECCVWAATVWGEELQTVDGVLSAGLVSRSEAYGVRFQIVDEETGKLLKDGNVGEIMVSSPSLASGYWGKPELTREAFQRDGGGGQTILATGDIGRIVDGHLYVCGRRKEVISLEGGRHVYPTDLERTLEKVFYSVIRPGSTVAYQHSSNSVGIVMELRNADEATTLKCSDIHELLQAKCAVKVGSIYVLQRGSVPKTTSGKLRRVETKGRSLADEWPQASVVHHWD